MELMNEQPGISLLRDFFQQGMERRLQKGQTLVDVADAPAGAYYIDTGHIKASTLAETGEERVHFILNSNDIFPLPWLFRGEAPQASYTAMDAVLVRYQPRGAFEKFVTAHPEVLVAIIHELLMGYERVYNLNLEPAEQRVIDHLLFLAEHFGTSSGSQSEGGFVVIKVALTQSDFANAVRISRETAGRILKDLEAREAVILGRRIIRAFPAKLRELLGD